MLARSLFYRAMSPTLAQAALRRWAAAASGAGTCGDVLMLARSLFNRAMSPVLAEAALCFTYGLPLRAAPERAVTC